MKAELIRGKPGRTKRERIEALDEFWSAYRVSGSTMKHHILAILNSPDEPEEPDMVQLSMTVEEAKWLNNQFGGYLPQGIELKEALKEALSQLNQ